MSGLNHESTEAVGSDTVLDLEVTSNRGDCLGHLGVAREAAVLLGNPLKTPDPTPPESQTAASQEIEVENLFEQACPLYTARIIKGVRVGPSPEWLSRRLKAVGINSVNNVVDVTNYVMLECGQPLHAFDLQAIADRKIVIRPAEDGEEFEAIDHRTYQLDSQMVVIADGQRSVALGGVMGGNNSEVSDQTVDLLIEAATFEPVPIRRAARKLKLHSPSSFRFERRPDPHGLDWASRRCCELILEVAGGELLKGVVADGQLAAEPAAISFRLPQLSRVLGIDVPEKEVDRILRELGCLVEANADGLLSVTPPTWRGDLTREVDLIEEVARIYGYEKIPEDVAVPMTIAAKRPKDVVLERARATLSAYGIDEAMTPSVVGTKEESLDSFWTDRPALATDAPLLEGAKFLRRSLLPSLLNARYANQAISQQQAQLYEVGTLFLPHEKAEALPREQSTLSIVGSGDLRLMRGLVEQIIEEAVGRSIGLQWQAAEHRLFEPDSLLQLTLDGQLLGCVGLVSKPCRTALSLDAAVAAAEISVDLLTKHLELVRRADPVSAYPSVTRDLNFVVDEQLTWASLADLCRANAGNLLTGVTYQETYRDTNKDGAGKKRLLLSLSFQSLERTLTGDEVDAAVQNVVAAATSQCSAKLLA